jgi:hypothetical protein
MTRTKYSAAMLFALLLALVTALAAPARAEIKNDQYLKIREEMKSLYVVQSLLSWAERTQGERSVFEQSYKGHEDLFSKNSIGVVDKVLKGKLSDEDRLAAKFMKSALALEYVALDTAHFGDEANNMESQTTVTVPWDKEPVPYRQLDVLLDQEEDPDRRNQLQEIQAMVWKEKLNPIYEREQKRVEELTKELGYSSVAAMSQELRNVDLKSLIDKSQAIIAETDGMYKELFAEQVKDILGKDASEFRRSDTGYFASVPGYKKFFPPELTIPAFMDLIEGMGMDMSTASGGEILVDDAMREKKNPRAACYSITVPDDVRITVKPSGGIPDFETFFHEGGHALHFANSTTPVWEYQQLGNNAVTESYAGFMEDMWSEPEWLLHYREFVKLYNKFQPPAKRVPVMTNEDIAKLIRNRVFWHLYFIRRYNGAKLLYESILHHGDASLWNKYYKGQTSDLHQVYKALFSDAYGYKLTDIESLRFRTDVDSYFYSADYARSFLTKSMMHEYVRVQFGEQWFRDPRAGEFLKSLWAHANSLQVEDVAARMNMKPLDPEISLQHIKRLMDSADALAAAGDRK